MPETTSVEVRGTFTVGDAARFLYFHQLRRMWWMVLPGVVLLALALVAIVGVAIYDRGFDRLGNAAGLIVPVAFYGVFLARPYLNAKQSLGGSAGRPLQFVLDGSGITSSDGRAEGRLRWAAVDRVYETKSLFALYTGAQSAIRIPKHFFATPEQERAFREVLRQHVDAGRFHASGVAGRWI